MLKHANSTFSFNSPEVQSNTDGYKKNATKRLSLESLNIFSSVKTSVIKAIKLIMAA